MADEEVQRIISEGLALGAADQVVHAEIQRMLTETASEYFRRAQGTSWEVIGEPHDEIAYGLPLGLVSETKAVLLPMPLLLSYCWHAPALREVHVVAASDEEAAEMAQAWQAREPVDPCPAPELHPHHCGPGPFTSIEDPAWKEANDWVNPADPHDEPPW